MTLADVVPQTGSLDGVTAQESLWWLDTLAGPQLLPQGKHHGSPKDKSLLAQPLWRRGEVCWVGSQTPGESGQPPEQVQRWSFEKGWAPSSSDWNQVQDRSQRWWEGWRCLGQEPAARPRQHSGAAIQPGRPLLWILGGAALWEPDGTPIRGRSVCLPCRVCF